MNNFELFIAKRYISANIKRSLIIIVAVSLGVGIIIWIPSVNLSFFNDLIDKSVSSAPHIRIEKELDTFDNHKKQVKKIYKDIILDNQTVRRKRDIVSKKDVIDKIKHLKEITGIAPYTEGNAFIIRGGDERGLSIKGIVPKQEILVTDIKNDIIKGTIENLDINGIVVGRVLADKMNLNLNDRVVVTGPRGDSKSLKVVGVFATGLNAQDEWQAYVSLKSGQTISDLGKNITGIGVNVKDIYKADKVAEEIEALTKLYVRSWKEDNVQILDQIKRFKLIILFINFLIITSAASSITSLFSLLIASKSREIGILKSMGAKKNSILRIFLSQAIILSLIGFSIGLILAKLLLIGYSKILEMSDSGFLFATDFPDLKLHFGYVLLAFLYSIISSFFASILPAYQAAKLNPIEAINS